MMRRPLWKGPARLSTARTRRWVRSALMIVALVPIAVGAATHVVSTDAELSAALSSAVPGDRVALEPGIYSGGRYLIGLNGIVLTSTDPDDPAILDAGGSGEVLHLSSASNVTIEHLEFRNYSANGINIDDGGNWPAGRSRGITLRRIVVTNAVAPSGNRDGIKLSGVDEFLIDGVVVERWGTGGSAIDPVGCHFGIVRNSRFVHPGLTAGSGVRPKGGSAQIAIRANRFELGGGRAVQAGGSTGSPFFRFLPGASGYEADAIEVTGNLVTGGSSAVSWVNIDGGVFRYNAIDRPLDWVMRMLNENVGTGLVETRGGTFADNLVVYGTGLRRISNDDGPGVDEASFSFARNVWYDADVGGPANEAALGLPAPESDGVYGVDPGFDPDGPVTFAMPWGLWVVNPHATAASVDVPAGLVKAMRTADTAAFTPLADLPIDTDWDVTPIGAGPSEVAPFGQLVLIEAGRVEAGSARQRVPALPGVAFLALAGALCAVARSGRRRETQHER